MGNSLLWPWRIIFLLILLFLSPLLLVLFLCLAFHPFQGMYISSLRVVNRTNKRIWVTPFGHFKRDGEACGNNVLEQFLIPYPAIWTLQTKNHRIGPGKSKMIFFHRKDLAYYEIVVRNSSREYRQLPFKSGNYQFGTNRTGAIDEIDNWDDLVTVNEEVVSATRGWCFQHLIWLMMFTGAIILYVYYLLWKSL